MEVDDTQDRIHVRDAKTSYVRPILSGLLIAVAGALPWAVLARMNRSMRPDVPWAALATVVYLAMLLAWLHGWGWPRISREARRRRLRLWPAMPAVDAQVGPLPVGLILLLLAGLYILWIIAGRLSPAPDLSAFPTTSYRWSVFIVGGLMSGAVEEAAFRGYMQTGLEQHDPDRAILITSLVFVAFHVTHGVRALVFLGPGLLVASMLYGVLARRTGTILPGMVIHIIGDLSYTFFGILGGDARLLFVPA